MTDHAAQTFSAFYRDVFLPEHQHPANVALHMLGTLLAIGLLPIALLSPWPWPLAALAFPVVHAAPGLIGHRMLERSAAVGDIRVLRTDYPKSWFVAANHVLTWHVLTAPFRRL